MRCVVLRCQLQVLCFSAPAFLFLMCDSGFKTLRLPAPPDLPVCAHRPTRFVYRLRKVGGRCFSLGSRRVCDTASRGFRFFFLFLEHVCRARFCLRGKLFLSFL